MLPKLFCIAFYYMWKQERRGHKKLQLPSSNCGRCGAVRRCGGEEAWSPVELWIGIGDWMLLMSDGGDQELPIYTFNISE